MKASPLEVIPFCGKFHAQRRLQLTSERAVEQPQTTSHWPRCGGDQRIRCGRPTASGKLRNVRAFQPPPVFCNLNLITHKENTRMQVNVSRKTLILLALLIAAFIVVDGMTL
jgi:hypothetical protein